MEQSPSRNAARPTSMPRDLQLLFYREIGIAAVAAALGVPVPTSVPAAREPRGSDQRRAA